MTVWLTAYLGQAEPQQDRFRDDIPALPGRWYTTGDLSAAAADGVLTYLALEKTSN